MYTVKLLFYCLIFVGWVLASIYSALTQKYRGDWDRPQSNQWGVVGLPIIIRTVAPGLHECLPFQRTASVRYPTWVRFCLCIAHFGGAYSPWLQNPWTWNHCWRYRKIYRKILQDLLGFVLTPIGVTAAFRIPWLRIPLLVDLTE